MRVFDAEVVLRPESAALRFLPEGPYPYADGVVSWVAIQHGAASQAGSLNLLDLRDGSNRSIDLVGRPGFAFPTDDSKVFVAGIERQLYRVQIDSGECEAISDPVEAGVEGTIINDAVAFEEGIVFGCKDLEFAEAKAGLYLWKSRDGSIVKLSGGQTCSNGKVIRRAETGWSLLDIDTPTQKIVRYDLDCRTGALSDPETVLDLTMESMFPDGMIETPDGSGVIIAFYNPHDAEAGVARHYDLDSGGVAAEWRCAKSPQVTCPQLVLYEDAVRLVLTTAVEHMSAERQAVHANAGCLFAAETAFASTPNTPQVVLG